MQKVKRLSPDTTPLHAYGVLIAGIIAVSLGSIFIRLAHAEGVPSLLVATGRVVIATLILTYPVLKAYAALIKHLTRQDLILAGIAGFFLALHFATWVSSLEYTSVLVSVALVNTNPLWVALMEVVFLKVSLSRNTIVALIIALMGGIIIVLPGSGDFDLGRNPILGAGLAITGAMTVAVYFTIGRKLRAKLPILPYIWLVYGSASLVLLAMVLVTGTPVTGYSGEAYLWLLVMAIIPQLIGHSSLNYALGYLQATFVTLSSQLEPVVSAVFAFFMFSETPGLLQILGSITILTGVIVASLTPRRLGKGARQSRG